MKLVKLSCLLICITLLTHCASISKSLFGTDEDKPIVEKTAIENNVKIPEPEKAKISKPSSPTKKKVASKSTQSSSAKTPINNNTANKSSSNISSSTTSKKKTTVKKTNPAKTVKKPVVAKPKVVIPAKKPVVLKTQTALPKSVKKSNIKGKVILLDSLGKALSSENTIVELHRLDSASNQKISGKTHSIITKDKTYKPGYLSINVGDTLSFKNNDGIKHNVFSSSGKNTFDLGTFGFKGEKQHKVGHEGIIKVYCNIHPEMALFVSASLNKQSIITNSSGSYNFSNLVPGKYQLTAWHLRGSSKKTITVTASPQTNFNITIDTSSYKPEPRVNKKGKAYKKKPAIFKDEFY